MYKLSDRYIPLCLPYLKVIVWRVITAKIRVQIFNLRTYIFNINTSIFWSRTHFQHWRWDFFGSGSFSSLTLAYFWLRLVFNIDAGIFLARPHFQHWRWHFLGLSHLRLTQTFHHWWGHIFGTVPFVTRTPIHEPGIHASAFLMHPKLLNFCQLLFSAVFPRSHFTSERVMAYVKFRHQVFQVIFPCCSRGSLWMWTLRGHG